MSLTTLAIALEEEHAAGAFLREGSHNVVASNLSADGTRRIAAAAVGANLPYEVQDQADTIWDVEHLDANFAPFRLAIQKPAPGEGVLGIFTTPGFSEWLMREDAPIRWQVVGLTEMFLTQGIAFAPWGETADFKPAKPSKSPRSLVREYSHQREVPSDIRRWLLFDADAGKPDDPFFQIWADMAIRQILISIPDEIDPEDGSLKFRGPPRLNLKGPSADVDALSELTIPAFRELQRAAAWVFENDREAESRHILLAAEIARSGGGTSEAVEAVRRYILPVLEGAKIAYQMSLSDLSSETLKALGELRKAITDETAKVTEATRTIVGAVASTLAIGMGLIAARLVANVNTTLIIAIMIVVLAYIGLVIASGIQFVLIQRKLRKEWQPRLYRFLPESDYKSMVTDPAGRAEAAMWTAAAFGTLAAVVLTGAVVYVAQLPPANAAPQPPSKEIAEDRNKAQGVTAPDAAPQLTRPPRAIPKDSRSPQR